MELKEIMVILCCKCGTLIEKVASAVSGTSRGGYCPRCYREAMEAVKEAVKGRK